MTPPLQPRGNPDDWYQAPPQRKGRRPREVGTEPPTRTPDPERTVIASTRAIWARRAVVYALVDEREPERVRYVGQSHTPEYRFMVHCASRSGRMGAWVNVVREARSHVLMRVLEICNTQAALDEGEMAWIATYRAKGMADLNRRDR